MNSPFSFDEELDASLDLTPLIDTVFMLLIFFIMATTFSKPVLEVALAKADSAAVKELDREKLTVTITEDSRILFDDQEVAEEDIAVSLEPLSGHTALVFNVDKGAPFGLFIKVLDVAKSQKRSDFIINATLEEAKRHDNPVADQ